MGNRADLCSSAVLQFAPSTYRENKTRKPSARAFRDEQLKPLITKCFEDNYRVYGAEKIWEQLLRQDIEVARCTVERLMKDVGIEGARRGKAFVVTTESDPQAARPEDFVKRKFSANAPNRLWVADLTYVRTLAGWVYVAFVIDVFSRKFIGWKVSTSLHADIALDALEMAFRSRRMGDALLHRLVQQPQAPRSKRHDPARRTRRRVLPCNQLSRNAVSQ
jgi:putative transposase